jgi:indoleacetamide hydrolase
MEQCTETKALTRTDSDFRCERHGVSAKTRRALERAQECIDLNIFISIDAAHTCSAAQAIDDDPSNLPLRGLMLAVKDNIHVAGLRNSAGTAALRDFVPFNTSPVVAKLQRLGAVVVGKAGMHELAYGVTSVNYAFGPVRNPLDPSRIAGGSSGGSAAAVAAGIVDVGIGTDTGGSIRLPAAMTGTVGFRPSMGVYSQDNVTLISNTRDTIGLIARNVQDVATIHAHITDTCEVAPRQIQGLRLGVPTKHFCQMLDEEVAMVFDKFLDQLADAGAELVFADLDDVPELNEQMSFSVCLFETAQLLPAYLASNNIDLTADQLVEAIKSPDVADVVRSAMAGAVTEGAYNTALMINRPRLQAAYADYFSRNGVHAVVFPTSPLTARPIEGLIDGVIVDGETHNTFQTYIRNTDPASNAGLPAISIPAGVTSSGLAVGAEIECPAGEDEMLLSIALGIETALGERPQKPIPNQRAEKEDRQ